MLGKHRSRLQRTAAAWRLVLCVAEKLLFGPLEDPSPRPVVANPDPGPEIRIPRARRVRRPR